MTFPLCPHCPFGENPGACPRWPSDHRRYCAWVDPADPDCRPDGAAALRRIAALRAARPAPPPIDVKARRAAKQRVALGQRVPVPSGGG